MRYFIYVLYAAQKLHDLCIKVYDPIDHNMLGPRWPFGGLYHLFFQQVTSLSRQGPNFSAWGQTSKQYET